MTLDELERRVTSDLYGGQTIELVAKYYLPIGSDYDQFLEWVRGCKEGLEARR